ncbi:MAG: hypothetical protein V7K32_20730 [Nostoc sp.]|uniref:hypothetical protein n=1 Tax=Nostoc sp. TaxID=1180 RepID=UPI002FFA4869
MQQTEKNANLTEDLLVFEKLTDYEEAMVVGGINLATTKIVQLSSDGKSFVPVPQQTLILARRGHSDTWHCAKSVS